MTTKTMTTQSLCALAVASVLSAPALAADLNGTSVNYGGYIKLDAMWSDFSDGSLGAQNLGRDFYIPSSTPVSATSSEDAVFDMHAKQSRFFFGTKTALDDGSSIDTKIELDFLVTPGGNERVSNSYVPRIRQAYVTYKGWLFGQAWSNFQNVGALPETLDFVGPTEGTVFNRQAMIKYTTGNWSFSMENPESTVTVNKAMVVTDDASMPDFTARYTHTADWGNFVVTALARQLTYKAGAADETESSFGISASGMVKVGSKDNVKFMLTQGSGLGRYVGLNAAHGAVYDGSKLDAIDSTSGFVAYQHFWSDQLRSTFLYSFFDADNNVDLLAYSGDPTKKIHSYSANILYSPVKKLTFGVEYKVANRETESGLDGDLDRIQLSAKYVF
ncbi:DcaP family trimeric outer membrane transporter [Pseudoalteromonas xiamenensis]|uniref:DcaP family trimeric outer membrane transporter n=1 Tax=Pseudoalteromonas xiamenensis TaxID=882626 RepID=UPI0035EB7410